MPTFTKHLNLRKPEENDFYNQETEQCENWDKLDEWSEGIDSKTKGATSLVPGIVKYGTDASTALEGSKLAEIYGIEPGGNLNNTNLKNAGKAYYCTVNKKTYKCIANTSINYADAAYFEEISNNDLLGKFKNLIKRLDGDNTNSGQIVDCNNLFDANGVPRFDEIIASSLNAPATPGICMTSSRDNGVSGFQLFIRNGPEVINTKMYVRTKNGGVLSPWSALL